MKNPLMCSFHQQQILQALGLLRVPCAVRYALVTACCAWCRAGIFRTAAEAKAAIDAKLGASAAKMRDEKLESCHRASAAAAAAAARAADQAAAAAAAAAQAAAAAAQAVEAGGGVKHRFGSIARYPTSTPARSGLQSYGRSSRHDPTATPCICTMPSCWCLPMS